MIPSLIHIDQVGYISGRVSANNMRRLLHVITAANNLTTPAIAVSLDAMKAFDRNEWQFMLFTLSKFNFGPFFMHWVSSVKTNRLISAPFSRHCGVHQVCPVSPLLFVLALEPLACAIRTNNKIKGISMHNYNFKLNLYADDILVTLNEPSESLPALLELVENFSYLSGYKINWSKSEAMPLNQQTSQVHLAGTPFIWKSKGMKYLGIDIISPITEMFTTNGSKLLVKIKDDLKRWTVLPISIRGRVKTLKMNILPRIMYILSAIPTFFPPSWFKQIKSLFIHFIWNNQKPRIGYKKLTTPRSQGGLGVPDVYFYYLSLNARYPLAWAYKSDPVKGGWEWLERKTILETKVTTPASLWYSTKPPATLNNSIIRFSCSIAKLFHKRLGINGLMLPSCPIWLNTLLTAGGKPLNNILWQHKGVLTIGQLCNENGICPFSDVKAAFGLPEAAFLAYLQIKSITSKFTLAHNPLQVKENT